MRKSFLLYFVFVVYVFSLVLIAAPARAGETVAYPDDFPPMTLQSDSMLSYTGILAPSNTEPNFKSPNLTGNSVTLNSNDSSLVKYVIGAANSGDTAPVTNNQVFIKSGSVEYAYGGWNEDGEVVGNSVSISGGAIDYVVNGGITRNADATNNTINITAGSTNMVEGGRSHYGDATGNKVTMTGGTTGGIIGGFSIGDVPPGIPGNAIGNEVTISGGSVYGVEGGRTHYGEATDNTVNISGNPTFDISSYIRGGVSTNGNDQFTGNTLKLGTSIIVWEVGNFEYYEFNIPASVGNGGALITVTNSTDIAGTTLDIKGIATGSSLTNGHIITLISKVTGAPAIINGLPYVPDANIATSYGTWKFSTSTGALTATAVSLPGSGGGGGGGGGGGCDAGAGAFAILSLAGLLVVRIWKH